MKIIFLIVSVLFILNGSVTSQTFSSNNQIAKNPANITSFKFNAKIKECYKLEGLKSAEPCRYPYVCQLQINKNSSGILCSGTLISVNSLLTSRTCIEGATQILVVCGSGKNNTVKGFSTYQSWPISSNGDYINIALVTLDESITLNNYISTVRIPQGDFDFTSKTITALNRFQYSSSSYYGTLQSLNLTVLPDSSCRIPHSFCSKVTKPEQDFYTGYLGGPSILTESDGSDTLIGINYASIKNAYHRTLQVSAKIIEGFGTNSSQNPLILQWIQQSSGIGTSDTLYDRDCLRSGQSLTSKNGIFTLTLLSNDVVGLFQTGRGMIWSAGFPGSGADKFCNHYAQRWTSGNVQLITPGNVTIWETRTSGSASTRLIVENRGVLTIFDGVTQIFEVGPIPKNQTFAICENVSSS